MTALTTFEDSVAARMPKCGTSTYRAIHRDATGRDHQPWGHHSARTLREKYPDRLIYGAVRPPTKWYRSYYEHVMRSGNPQWLYPFLPPKLRNEQGVLNEYAVFFGLTHHWMYDAAEAARLGRTEPLSTIDMSGWNRGGLWSYMTEHYYGDGEGGWEADVLINTDRLGDGLATLFGDESLREKHVNNKGSGRLLPLSAMTWVLDEDLRVLAALGGSFITHFNWTIRVSP